MTWPALDQAHPPKHRNIQSCAPPLAEIVGLELQDIDMEQELINIRPNSIRRLKTKNSERYLLSRYVRAGKCKADHASAALGKWLKKDFNGLTAHCLRHTFKDRLRAVECPLEIIDQIGGWSSISSIGSSYWMGYELKTRKSI